MKLTGGDVMERRRALKQRKERERLREGMERGEREEEEKAKMEVEEGFGMIY